MAKGKKGKKSKQDEDEEWESAKTPQLQTAGKGKTNIEDEGLAGKIAEVTLEPMLSKSQLKKQKRNQKKAGKGGFADLEVEENELSDKEEPEEVILEAPKRAFKKSKKGKKSGFVDLAESDDETVSKRSNQKSEVLALAESEEDEDSEEIEEKMMPKNKKGKRGGFATLIDSEEEDHFSEETEEVEQQGKKIKNKGGFVPLANSVDENLSGEIEEKKYVGRKNKKDRKSGFSAVADSDDDENDVKTDASTKVMENGKNRESVETEGSKKNKRHKKGFQTRDNSDGEYFNSKSELSSKEEIVKESESEPKKKAKKEKKKSKMEKLLAEMEEVPVVETVQEEKKKPEPLIEKKKKRAKKTEAVTDTRDEVAAGDEDGPVFFDMEEERIRKKQKEEERIRGEMEEKMKSMTRKERKKYTAKMQLEADLRAIEEKTATMGNFTVSQQENAKDNQVEGDDIIIEDFSISAGGRDLFKNAKLKITAGRRYGLVGPNGRGKTTLLRHIGNKSLKIPKHIDVLYCEQEVKADDTPAIQAVLEADVKLGELQREQKFVMARFEKGDMSVTDRMHQLDEELVAMGAESAEPRARRILSGLGFTERMQTRATKDFSGGWRMRVSLARALFLEPTLLLLDEPTNHLDLNAVIWLDNYLCAWKKTLLVVSHDAGFLDNICTDIVHLDARKLVYYKGNYSQFQSMHKQRMIELMKAYEKQEKNIRANKARGMSKAKSETKQREALTKKQMKNRSKLSEMQASEDTAAHLIERPREYNVKFRFPDIDNIAPPILGLYDVGFGYEGQRPLFKGINFGVDMGSRISIVGPNGVGKSTLLKLLIGELPPTRGEMRRNHRVRIGYYSQHSAEQLELNQSPAEYLVSKFDANDDLRITTQQARKHLGSVGLESHAHTIPNRDLSGGQKARVALAELIIMAPDIIILDEPTNNLDLESIDALGEAINDFGGGVIIVSHDSRLICETECQLWVVEEQTLNEIDGGFYEYREEILKELGEEINALGAAGDNRDLSSEEEEDSDDCPKRRFSSD